MKRACRGSHSSDVGPIAKRVATRLPKQDQFDCPKDESKSLALRSWYFNTCGIVVSLLLALRLLVRNEDTHCPTTVYRMANHCPNLFIGSHTRFRSRSRARLSPYISSNGSSPCAKLMYLDEFSFYQQLDGIHACTYVALLALPLLFLHSSRTSFPSLIASSSRLASVYHGPMLTLKRTLRCANDADASPANRVSFIG